MSIRLENAGYSYQRDPKTKRAVWALKDVSLFVPDGSLRCLVGATGSGKSTLAKLACGVLRPQKGEVAVDDKPLWLPRGLFGRLRRDPSLYRRAGYVMQRPERQLFCETVLEDVAFGPENLGESPDEARDHAREALASLGIQRLADRSPFALSGGQQRLAAIAGVLAMGPRNLVMDEPMGSLDPRGRDIVRDAVAALHDRGATVLLITHDMNDVALLADSVTVMDRGRVAAQGTPAEVFSRGDELRAIGLGVPDALALARHLESAAGVALGEPLTLEALADAVAAAAGLAAARSQGGAPCA